MAKLVTNIYKKVLVGSVVVHLILLLVTRFTAWPEMLAWPYLLAEGWLPYKDIAMAHTPLLTVALSLFYKLFGVGISQLQLFTWFIILSTSILTWFISKKLFGEKIALFTIVILPLYQFFYEGNGLWFDIVLAPLSMVIFFLLHKKKYISAGAMWGIALFVKQTAIWLLIPVVIHLFASGSKKIMEMEKRYVPFFYGTVLVMFAGVLLMYLSGVLPYFSHWAIEFGIFTLPTLTGQVDAPMWTELSKALVPFVPLVLLVLFSKQKPHKEILLWSIFASIGAYPRWGLFHFQPAVPFLAIGTAMSIDYVLSNKRNQFLKLILLVPLITFAVLFIKLASRNINQPIRFYETSLQQVVDEVKLLSGDSDEIYVINYWDSVYALADRKPAVRPLVPYIPWYLNYQNFDKYVALEVRSSLPQVIVRGDYGDGLSAYKIDSLEDTIDRYYRLYSYNDGVSIYIKN